MNKKIFSVIAEGTAIPTPPAKIPNYKQIKTDKERQQLNAATQRVGVFEGAVISTPVTKSERGHKH